MLSAYEKSDNARTYLVTNENDDILGYFSLALSVVDIPPGISKAMMKKMRGFGRYSADSVPCYLLGQLARDDNASHDDLMMRDFIDFAIEYVMAKDQQDWRSEPAYHVLGIKQDLHLLSIQEAVFIIRSDTCF